MPASNVLPFPPGGQRCRARRGPLESRRETITGSKRSAVDLARQPSPTPSDPLADLLTAEAIGEDEAAAMIVGGFIEPLVKELPMEYAVEMNRLIQLQMEGSIG